MSDILNEGQLRDEAMIISSATPIRSANDALERILESHAALRSELAVLNKDHDDWVEREGACCPEDVAFDDFIRVLQKALAAKDAEILTLLKMLDRSGAEICSKCTVDCEQICDYEREPCWGKELRSFLDGEIERLTESAKLMVDPRIKNFQTEGCELNCGICEGARVVENGEICHFTNSDVFRRYSRNANCPAVLAVEIKETK